MYLARQLQGTGDSNWSKGAGEPATGGPWAPQLDGKWQVIPNLQTRTKRRPIDSWDTGTTNNEKWCGSVWITDFLIYSAVAFAFIYGAIIYNGLIRLKNNVEQCLANIEVLLKQRHTELPRLVEVCKGIMKHERELLVDLVEARERVHIAQENHDVQALGSAETQIRQAVGKVFLRAEAYPELKTNENMLELQERIAALENAIADRRELYNASVGLNNTRVKQLPDVLFARAFKFDELKYLKFEADAMTAVRISLAG